MCAPRHDVLLVRRRGARGARPGAARVRGRAARRHAVEDARLARRIRRRPAPFIDLLINAARPFIFTTAPTPADSAAALAARSRRALPRRRRPASNACAPHVERVAPGHPSPIVPIVLGDEQRALDASARLLADHGLLVPAIRPPTVAPGTSRLRVALSAAHTDDEVERLAKALADL